MYIYNGNFKAVLKSTSRSTHDKDTQHPAKNDESEKHNPQNHELETKNKRIKTDRNHEIIQRALRRKPRGGCEMCTKKNREADIQSIHTLNPKP